MWPKAFTVTLYFPVLCISLRFSLCTSLLSSFPSLLVPPSIPCPCFLDFSTLYTPPIRGKISGFPAIPSSAASLGRTVERTKLAVCIGMAAATLHIGDACEDGIAQNFFYSTPSASGRWCGELRFWDQPRAVLTMWTTRAPNKVETAPVAEARLLTLPLREAFCARKHVVSCDSVLIIVTLTKQFQCDLVIKKMYRPPEQSPSTYLLNFSQWCREVCTFLLSSLRNIIICFLAFLIYCLRFCLFFTSLPSSHPYFPTFFAVWLSSLVYCLHVFIVFAPLFSSHLYCFHLATFFTSLLPSLLYCLQSSTFFTSLLSSHLYLHSIYLLQIPNVI